MISLRKLWEGRSAPEDERSVWHREEEYRSRHIVTSERRTYGGKAYVMAVGGSLTASFSPAGPRSVMDLLPPGAEAGVNGVPVVAGEPFLLGECFQPGIADAGHFMGRPLVLWGREKYVITPYDDRADRACSSRKALLRLLPEAQHAVLGAGWLVRLGRVYLDDTRLSEPGGPFHVPDAKEPMLRSAFGWCYTDDWGRDVYPFLAVSLEPVTASEMAVFLWHSGVADGILLASGPSTQMVADGKVVRAKGKRKGPVPPVQHAVVLR